MRSSVTIKYQSQENFHKICVVGGGITGAVMVLLLKNSNMFKLNEIGWIKPKLKSKYDFRTTFYNETSLKLLNNFNILKKLKKNDYTSVKNIKVFGPNHSSPLEWDYFDTKRELGAVIKNDIVLNIIEDSIKDIKKLNCITFTPNHSKGIIEKGPFNYFINISRKESFSFDINLSLIHI